ncbi:T9SS type A sorting domain-containing protein [Hymenobacter busanensis]|uniref:T9SS type A sorting domain-containing protein n=1 Tax=Hymenobacter busanensis TaxID=2607656 RepID=A0A7L5A0C6_9BACT|nr:T9SS type A sorting domain-containing protein [Hymenobacter busanensis]KAA9331488.1 T9SS type A sorting domain-containing protein [Hymenobacter busanensis]QHJ08643.1 hypothetical protein GUY19_15635 [Hymenobacter busanensis]
MPTSLPRKKPIGLLGAAWHTGLGWLLCLSLLLPFGANAQSGIYEGYVVLNANGSGNTFYDMVPSTTTANPDFTGSLGTFTPAQSLVLSGAQLKTFKNLATDDVQSARLQYRVYLGTGAGSGAFTAINLPFDGNIGGAGAGFQNQQWTNTSNTANLLAGLPNGTYTLEVYGEASTTPGGTVFYSNSGANYKATFTVSNPSTALINESFEGGFGSFTTVLNGSATNKWFTGTAAGATQGSAAAYISNDPAGATHTYTSSTAGGSEVVHFYQDVAIPAGQTLVSLSFDWKNNGENNFDYLRVSYAPTSFTPTVGTSRIAPGTAISGTGTGTPTIIVDNLRGQSSGFVVSTSTLPTSTAGTTIRLIFTWVNDNASANQPPAAVDNVVLTSRAPLLLSGQYTIDNTVATGGRNFQTWTAAVAALNEGLGGAVTFNVTSGQTFNEAPLTITATGTASNTITFQKSGPAANPVVQGTGGTGSTDAVITLNGSDYVTITSIDLKDNTANATATTKMERGLWLNALSGTDGCQFVTYQNGTITLDKTNANGPVGIYTLSSATAAGGANSNLSVLNSTIQNALRGIQLNGGSTALDQNTTIQNTTITNLSPTGSTAASGIDFNAQNLLTISNNTLNTFSAAASTGPLYGLSNLTTASTNLTISGNTITGFTSALASSGFGVVGIDFSVASTGNISNNTITQLSCSATATGLYGIASTSTTSRFNVFDNKINNLTLTSTASNTAGLEGIDVATPSGQTVNIYRNYIHTLIHSGSSTNNTYGIRLQNGSGAANTVCNIYNNLIANLRADASSSNPGVRGIAISVGNVVNVYYNTVYLSGTATNTSHQSAALNATTGMNSLDYRNNILVNKYVLAAGATGTSRAVAFYRTSAAVTTLATTSNNNLLYGTTALYYDGTNSATTLAQYRLLVNGGTVSTPRESAAVTESTTPFVSAADPHLTPGGSTQAEGGAQPLTGGSQSGLAVADDYDQNPRNATTPDIGADEGAFTAIDLTAPLITIGTPLTNTTSTTGPTLTNVTITDASGVNVTAGTAPRLYYKLSTDANTFNDNTSTTAGFKYVEATGTTSPFSFVLDYSRLPGNVGGALPAGTTIQYFVVAQDLAGSPNVGISSPNTFAATPASVALTSAAFPIGGTLPSYSIQASFSGTVNVGPGQTYTSLTAAGGLFQALNGGILTGNLTVLITGDITTEDGSNVLNPPTEQGTGSYTIRVQPSAPTLRTITGWAATGTGSPSNGVTLNGADRVIFDGRFDQTGTDKFLLFRNANVNGVVFNLIQDATNNVIQYVVAEGAGTLLSNGVITFGSSSSTAVFNGVTAGVTGNDNNQVLNCDIRDLSNVATSQPGQGVYSVTTSTISNSGNTISGCNIFNFTFQGFGVATGTGGSNWTISNNSFYSTGPAAVLTATGLNVINLNFASSVTGIVVSGNYIGGSQPQAGGAAWVNSSPNGVVKGIRLVAAGTSNAPSVSISGNVVRNFTLSGGGSSASFIGIDATQSSLDNTSYSISGNTVSNITSNSTQSGGIGSIGLVGIAATTNASASTAQLVTGNTVSDLDLNPAVASTPNIYVTGIQTRTSTVNTGTISRNRVYNLTNSGTAATAGVVGIALNGGSWTVANNQVTLGNTSAAVSSLSNAPIIIGILNNTSLITTENFYFNSALVNGTAGTGAVKTYAFRMSGTAGSLLRNNVLVNVRTGGTGGHFAIGVPGSATFPGSVNSNYNNLYAAVAGQTAENNATALTFAAWQAQTGSPDANSKNSNAKFVDPSAGNLNLDPTTNCQLNNAGLAVAGVNGEFDNAATDRQTTPDIGSDEFSYTQQLAAFAGPTTQQVCTGGSATLTVNSAGNGGLFTVVYSNGTAQTTVNNATAGQAITVPLVGASTTYTLVSVTDAYGCSLGVSGSANTVTLNETTTTTWTGSASTDWFSSANWTNCVPSAAVDAVVPSGTANKPALGAGAAAVRTLTFAGDAKLAMTGGTLSVSGNWTRTGTGATSAFSGGTVAFVGSTAQQLTDAVSFFDLTVNKPGDTLRLAANQNVAGTLSLSGGILKTYTPATTYQVNLAGSLTETASSYVLGNVVVAATLSTDGSTSNFGGVGLTLTAHGNGTTTALPGPTTVTRSTGKPVYGTGANSTNASIRRQFAVVPTTDTNLNVDLVFGYADSGYELNGLAENRLALYSAATAAGPWRPEGGNRDTGANTVTKLGLDHLSVWTLGSLDTPLPVSLTSFEAKRDGTNAVVTWATAQEKNSRGFEVQVSADGVNYRTLGFVASESPNSSGPRSYRFIDREAGKLGLRYYRLRQFDFDGKDAFFGPRTLQFEAPAQLGLAAYPTRFGSQLTVEVSSPTAAHTTVELLDAVGRVLLRQPAELVPGLQQLPLRRVEQLATGTYLLRLTATGQTRTVRVVKE